MNNSTTNQNINPAQSDYLNAYDRLTRYLHQTRSLVTAISHSENLDELNSDTMMNVLWLLSDRLDDIKQATNDLFNAVEKL